MNRKVLTLISFLSLFVAPAAYGQAVDSTTRSTARELGYQGVQAYEAGDYALASERLERAYGLLKAPSLAFWSARALEKQGKLVDASERYLEATRLSIEDTSEQSVQEKAQADAQAAHDALAPRIPRLVISIRGADAGEVVLSIDGAEAPSALTGAPLPLDPGSHDITAAQGTRRARATVALAEGKKATLTFRFHASGVEAEFTADPADQGASSAPPKDRGPSQPGPNLVGPIVLLASGVAVMTAGLALIVSSKSCYDPYGYYCTEDSGLLTAGAVLTPIGVAAAAGGGVWLGIKLSRHKKASAPTAGLSLVPVRAGVGLGVVGSF